ncbi:MAG: hypothetical protein WC364_13800 [Eubacteriales bacterium]|jgi:hypothetical protein
MDDNSYDYFADIDSAFGVLPVPEMIGEEMSEDLRAEYDRIYESLSTFITEMVRELKRDSRYI